MASEDPAAQDREPKRMRLENPNTALTIELQLHPQLPGLSDALCGIDTDTPVEPPSLTCRFDAYLKTLRVRGLSALHNKDTARDLIKSKLALEGSLELQICSLALSPHRPDEKVATITFKGTSGVLPSDRNEWVADVPDVGSNGDHPLSQGHQQHIIIDSHFEGFTPLSSCERDADHKIDIVAVSGLGSHAFGSFKERGGQHMWLRDALPGDVPGARVLIYGYHAKLADSRSFQDLEALASAFRVSLGGIRYQHMNSARRKPLIFIGHSLGGLIIKEAVIQMKEGNDLDKFNFACTRGILFFGVPNQGIDIDSLIPMVQDHPNMLFLLTLGKESGYLRNQHRAFFKAFDSKDSRVISFYETEESPTAQKRGDTWAMTGKRAVLVDSFSATHSRPWESEAHHIQGINRTHSDIVKFSPQDKYYYIVLQHLRELVASATIMAQTQTPEPQELTEEQIDCLKSLSSSEFGNRFSDVCDPHDATFHWIWENKAFCQWLQNDEAIFWVQGKPGCGKSTLMKLLLQKRSAFAAQMVGALGERPITAAYFFCGRGTPLERSLEGMLRSLLVQILRQNPSLFRHALEAYGQMKESRSSDGIQWSLSSLRRIFVSSITEGCRSRGVCLFVDALDECDGPLQDHVSFLRKITTYPALKSTIKICVSGRPIAVLCASLGGYPGVSLPEETSGDIYKYVQEKTESLCQSNGDDDDGDDIEPLKSEIVQKANGVFLWVTLVVEELLKGYAEGDTISELRDRLAVIPPDLDGMYHQILTRVEERYLEESRLAMRLVLCALWPMTLTEFRYAIAFGSEKSFESQSHMQASKDLVRGDGEMEKRIRSRCGGLIEVSTSESDVFATVKFMHQSVKDFLLFGDGVRVLRADSREDSVIEGHRYLLRACIRYLTIPELKDLRSQIQNTHPDMVLVGDSIRPFPFLAYAALQWPEHWKALESLGACQSSQVRKLQDGEGCSYFQTWTVLFNAIANSANSPILRHPCSTTLLHLATEAGIVSFVKEEIQAAADLNALGGRFGTLLQTAARAGDASIVGLLLQCGAGIDCVGSPWPASVTATQMAARMGCGPVVRLLLENGPDVNGPIGHFGSVLQAAAHGGQDAIAQLLLENAANVNAGGGYYGNALQAAGAGGHDTTARLLLKNGADVNAKGGFYGNALQAAVAGGHDTTAQLLLKNGADVNAKGGFYGNALYANADGAGFYGSALQAASAVAAPTKVRLLLDNGATVNTHTGYYQTPLHRATIARCEEVARMLVENTQDVNAADIQGCTALHMVAKGGWSSLLNDLICTGSDPLSRDKQGRSALHHAASGENAICIRQLLEIFGDPNIPDRNGWTPLHWAVKGGNADAVSLLLKCGGDAHRRTHDGWSLIRVALFHGYDDIVIDLLTALKPPLADSLNPSTQKDNQAAAQPPGNSLGQFRRGSRHGRFVCDGCEHVNIPSPLIPNPRSNAITVNLWSA
ncbi:MAG: hypothetical protein M1839_008060 [Geoglossum umbratile]|nr:MAG: hypothetical protein M1839_008060 [Geoglossum umbratile]